MTTNSSDNVSRYTTPGYFEKNPTWHVEDSPWKSKEILKIMTRNNLTPKTVCEVGCGAGEILVNLQQRMTPAVVFDGYDISPYAHQLAIKKANKNLRFHLEDITKEDVKYDLILLIDIVEHLEDPFRFLRDIKKKAPSKILRVPLDLSVQAAMRVTPIMRARALRGHLHYFNKETILATLHEVGYEVIDYFYSPGVLDLPAQNWVAALSKPIVRFAYLMNQDLTARFFGGISLMILTQ